jgi:hypothetical protein
MGLRISSAIGVRMRTRLSLCLLVMAAFGLPCLAGTVVFSNLVEPGALYGPDGVGIGHTPAFPPTSPEFVTYATPFTVQFDSRLSMIEVPIGLISGPSQAGAALLSDAGGAPGTLIEAFLLTNLPTLSGPSGFPLVQVPSTLNPILSPGQKYWFSATGGGITFAMWSLTLFQGDAIDGGATRIEPPPGAWIVGTGTRTGALRVTGDPVPEPASFLLTAVGFVALATLARRQRNWRGNAH